MEEINPEIVEKDLEEMLKLLTEMNKNMQKLYSFVYDIYSNKMNREVLENEQ